MNKGIAKASGEIVGILNSDDFYVDNAVLANVLDAFVSSVADAVYGDLEYVDSQNISKVVRKWRAGNFTHDSFRYGWHPPHPSFFLKRSLYDKLGIFKSELRISADYELMLRFLYIHKIPASYIPKVLVKMRTGGTSGEGLNARKKAFIEDIKAWQLNGLEPPFGTIFMKRFRKLLQWL
jgi:glycosyltransferase